MSERLFTFAAQFRKQKQQTMIQNETIINYVPDSEDVSNISKIRDFLIEMNIPYTESEQVYGMFIVTDIKGGDIELRYISSKHYHMDNSKRFGEEHKGIPNNYFINISQKNLTENNIRTIWIFDFEMNQTCDIEDDNGNIIHGYYRQWEVIKNTIRTATGHIFHRFYARDCEICIVENKELRNFLNTNCFYGYRSGNINLGLRLKKDKGDFKKGTLLFVYTFGMCFYGNKNHQDEPKIEIIRVATKTGCQVIGGSSKCLKHFLENYKTITVNGKDGKKEVNVNELIFFVDSSHLDSRSMTTLGFEFLAWKGEGFMNVFLEDVDEVYIRPDGQKVSIKGKKGEIQQRKPLAHKRIMELIKEKKIVSVANAGTSVYHIFREKYLQELEDKKKKIVES